MAGSVNKVILIGNVGRDPEIRSTQTGQRIANFSMATTDTWRDRQSGERRERTEWHRIAVFNDGLVGVIERFVRKGSKLYIEGSLQTRKWTDQQGMERFTTEVVLQSFNGQLTLLDSRNASSGSYDNNSTSGGSFGNNSPSHNDDTGGFGNAGSSLDDDIPF